MGASFVDFIKCFKRNDLSEGSICCICQDVVNIDTHKSVQIDGCAHIFGAKCLQGWFNKRKNTCPLCRTPLFKQLDYEEGANSVADSREKDYLAWSLACSLGVDCLSARYWMYKEEEIGKLTPPSTIQWMSAHLPLLQFIEDMIDPEESPGEEPENNGLHIMIQQAQTRWPDQHSTEHTWRVLGNPFYFKGWSGESMAVRDACFWALISEKGWRLGDMLKEQTLPKRSKDEVFNSTEQAWKEFSDCDEDEMRFVRILLRLISSYADRVHEPFH